MNKKNTTKKKVVKKKTTKKKNVVKKITKTNIVDVDKDLMKLGDGKKLSLIPANQMPINKTQILTLFQRTPQQHICKRPGKGGGQFEYVTGVYVKKVLNYVFGFNWDFEIIEHGVIEKHQVWVKGRLTVRDGKGSTVCKMQFGRADIKMKKVGGYLDFGNDLKAATTDALKKCASEFGIASDIYGKKEFKDMGVKINDEVENVENKETAIIEVVRSKKDYCTKLVNYVLKQDDSISKTEIVSWINMILKTKYTKSLLTNQQLSQQVLAKLIQQ